MKRPLFKPGSVEDLTVYSFKGKAEGCARQEDGDGQHKGDVGGEVAGLSRDLLLRLHHFIKKEPPQLGRLLCKFRDSCDHLEPT